MGKNNLCFTSAFSSNLALPKVGGHWWYLQLGHSWDLRGVSRPTAAGVTGSEYCHTYNLCEITHCKSCLMWIMKKHIYYYVFSF